jgi:Skp family chaperone for outer membrane proteins
VEEHGFIDMGRLVQQFSRIFEMERDIEDMVKDDILDIFVDQNGKFYYKLSDKYYEQIKHISDNIERKMSSFDEMCLLRGIDEGAIKTYRTMNH